jgi:hypothetical protein
VNNRIVVATLAAATLAVPSVAIAKPSHGKGHEKQAAKAHGKGKQPKKVTFVFKGKFTAPGTVDVVSGNSHVRKGGFVGQAVIFDFANAKVVAPDTNADQKVDVTDVNDGDVVLVQARIARRSTYTEGAETIIARKLVDKTSAPADDDESTDGAGDGAPPS